MSVWYSGGPRVGQTRIDGPASVPQDAITDHACTLAEPLAAPDQA